MPMAMDQINHIICNDKQLWDWTCEPNNHICIVAWICKTIKQHAYKQELMVKTISPL